MEDQRPEKLKTAILFFARTPEKEVRDKKFSSSDQKNRILFSFFNKSTLGQIEKTGLDVFFWDEKHQKGSTFGERFTHAFSEIFKKGYSAIISVGNDTPELGINDLLRSIKALNNGQKLILGPSNDGGVYLIGLTREVFEPDQFNSISWNTNEVFEQLKSFSALSTVLDLKYDLDDLKGVLKFLKSGSKYSAIVRILRELISTSSQKTQLPGNHYSFLLVNCNYSRPPPGSRTSSLPGKLRK